MTNPAHNALHDVHLFDHLAEKHRNRVRQAAQQSDAEGASSMCIPYFGWTPEIGRANAEHRRKNAELREEYMEACKRADAVLAKPVVEDAIWHEIPQSMPPADPVAEDRV